MSLSRAGVPGPDEDEILRRFGLDRSRLLGAGGEARVFALDETRVLRILHPGDADPDPRPARLLDSWAGVDIGVALSTVLDRGVVGSQHWTLDRRIPGRSLLAVLQETADAAQRRALLRSAVDVASRLRRLPIPAGPHRTLCTDDPPATSLAELLDHRVGVGIRDTGQLLAARVPDLRGERRRLRKELEGRDVPARFVHLDFYPANVLVDGDTITGVCDLGAHALAADPVLDEVGAVCLLGGYEQAEEDSRALRNELADRLGADAWLVDCYRRFYGFYYAMDASLLDWAAAQFRP